MSIFSFVFLARTVRFFIVMECNETGEPIRYQKSKWYSTFQMVMLKQDCENNHPIWQGKRFVNAVNIG